MHPSSEERTWLTWLVKVRMLILTVLLGIELAVFRLTPSVLPVAATLVCLLADPRLAAVLVRRGWGANLLTPRTIAAIAAMAEETR